MGATATRRHVIRVKRGSLALMVLLLLLPLASPVATATPTGQWRVPGPATKLYIGQFARLTAQIPASWTVDPNSTYDYSGTDGFVFSMPLPGGSLRDACDQVATSIIFASPRTTERLTVRQGTPVCMITAPAVLARNIRASQAIVIPHPHPFTAFNMAYSYALLVADPAHFPSILATLSFAPERVTPLGYVMSALDIAEARSLFRDKIDWGAKRTVAPVIVTDWNSAHDFLRDLIWDLHAWGDNHSQWISPDVQQNSRLRQSGFGLFIVGKTVLQVNRDGPAAKAGVQAGDRILTVDGGAMPVPAMPQDLGFVFPDAQSVTLDLLRPRTGQRITISLERQTYDGYLPPTGQRLTGNIGYVELFDSLGLQSDADYTRAAQAIIAGIAQRPTCGWVVDLRSNYGGSISPMLQGLAPLIGNGRIFGFITVAGHVDWYSMKNGALFINGAAYAPAVGPNAPASLADLPVAVLVGPSTASAAEITTMAFIGRDQARLFGSPTFGATTGVRTFPLFDGYLLALATVKEMNRSGHVYDGSISPDQQVPTSPQSIGTDQDAVINAATGWLAQQPACQQMNAQATPAG